MESMVANTIYILSITRSLLHCKNAGFLDTNPPNTIPYLEHHGKIDIAHTRGKSWI
jgi:hypothetical protein